MTMSERSTTCGLNFNFEEKYLPDSSPIFFNNFRHRKLTNINSCLTDIAN